MSRTARGSERVIGMAENRETVTVEGSFQTADYWRANKYVRNRMPRTWVARIIILFVPSIVILYKYRTGPEDWTWWVLLVPVYVVVLLVVVAPLIDRAFLRRRLQSIPSAFRPQSYVFSDAGMEITGEDKHVELKWGAIIKAAESPNDFFLYVGSNVAQFIPKRFLTESSQQARLREILRRNLGRKAVLQ